MWADFDKGMHHWLLRLTEEFDLTFPSKDEACNIVPCLLADVEKEVTTPSIYRGEILLVV